MNLIRKLAEEQARRDSKGLPKANTIRRKSVNELLTEYHPQGYYLYFCFHDKTLYEVCSQCRRTRRDAQRNLSNL
jgi:hypothetical protein